MGSNLACVWFCKPAAGRFGTSCCNSLDNEGTAQIRLVHCRPMVFMIITTIAALFLLVRSNITKAATLPLAIVAIVLIILAVWLVVEAYNAW